MNERNIIIIDDDRESNKLLQTVLQGEDFGVTVVASTDDAEESIKERKYNLVIANLNLIQIKGYEACKWLKLFAPQAKVILISNGNQQFQNMELSSFDSFQRPLDLQAVVAKVKKLLLTKGFVTVIDDMRLIDYLQIFCLNKSTKALSVTYGQKKGVVLIQNGNVVYALQDKQAGEKALLEILGWKKGVIKTIKVKKFPVANITRDINGFLIDAQETVTKPKVEIIKDSQHSTEVNEKFVSEKKEAPEVLPVAQVSNNIFSSKIAAICAVLLIPVFAVLVGAANVFHTDESTEILGVEQLVEEKGELQKTIEIEPLVAVLSPLVQQTRQVVLPAVEVPNRQEIIILRLHGSNTIGAKLGPELAKQYLQDVLGAQDVKIVSEQGRAEVKVIGEFNHEDKVIEIHAHGSSTGFRDLDAGLCDIAMSSRKIKDKEVATLQRFGAMRESTNEHVLALDGVAVIVNKGNPLQELELDDVKKLFSGELTSWVELGGKDEAVKVFSRDNNSGTFDTFKSLVLGKKTKLTETAKRYDSNKELSLNVSQEAAGVGFTSLSHMKNIKGVALADGGAKAVYPSFFTVATEDYPLSRRLFLYTADKSDNEYVFDFVEFAMSKEGQRIVENVGFVDMNIKSFVQNAPDPVVVKDQASVSNYVQLTGEAERLSVNFRFKINSISLDNRGTRDLDRMVEYLKNNRSKKITLIGFADNSGNYLYNKDLATQRVEVVNQQLKMRGLSIQKVMSLGEEIPVASNFTKEGREKNRRVEVWVK